MLPTNSMSSVVFHLRYPYRRASIEPAGATAKQKSEDGTMRAPAPFETHEAVVSELRMSRLPAPIAPFHPSWPRQPALSWLARRPVILRREPPGMNEVLPSQSSEPRTVIDVPRGFRAHDRGTARQPGLDLTAHPEWSWRHELRAPRPSDPRSSITTPPPGGVSPPRFVLVTGWRSR